MKKRMVTLLALAFLLLLAGCSAEEAGVAGKLYVYEGEVSVGTFSIAIFEDGTYSYYEGAFSSYIGVGTWSVSGSVLTLTEDDELGYPFVNHFQIRDGDIVFMEDGSSNFLYIDVKDGEVFHGTPIPPKEPDANVVYMAG